METKNDNRILRAKIIAEENESEDYDFACLAVPSQNGQIRYSVANDEYFKQVLRTSAESVDTSRLDVGIPIFDNHPWEANAKDTLGVTVGYEFREDGVFMRCKFGARADEALRADVKNGIIKTVSIEGQVSEYTVTRNLGELPIYEASRWTPESLSFAPVPQDISAQIEVKRAIAKQITVEKPLDFLTILTNKFI